MARIRLVSANQKESIQTPAKSINLIYTKLQWLIWVIKWLGKKTKKK